MQCTAKVLLAFQFLGVKLITSRPNVNVTLAIDSPVSLVATIYWRFAGDERSNKNPRSARVFTLPDVYSGPVLRLLNSKGNCRGSINCDINDHRSHLRQKPKMTKSSKKPDRLLRYSLTSQRTQLQES
jgi:hypothetical protein